MGSARRRDRRAEVTMRELRQLEVTDVATEPVAAIMTHVTCQTDGHAIAAALSVAFGRLLQYAQRHALQVIAAPRAIYTAYGGHATTFTAALPIDPPGEVPPPTAHIGVGELPAFRGWRFVHVGAYESMPTTYARITEWLVAHRAMASDNDWVHLLPMWEEYVSDPGHTPPRDLVTYIHVPRPGDA